MEIKLAVKFVETISGRREVEVGFFRYWFLQNTTQKAVWETLTHDLKTINLKQQAIFCFGAKNAQNQLFVSLSTSEGYCRRLLRKRYTW